MAVTARLGRNLNVAAWSVVIVVGVLVLVLVFALQLYPRLNSGQKVIDGIRPALTKPRVEGSRAGVTMVSNIVDLADPIVKRNGGAAGEVPKLVSFVSTETGLTPKQVMATLGREFPHTTGLLLALPLEDVSAEIPKLVDFLATTLKMSPEEVMAALGENFPRLTQSIQALPKVANGWDDVPGTAKLTRFNGDPVRTVPDVRDYFAKDVIPVLEKQRSNYQTLVTTSPPVEFFPPLLTIVGILVIAYGLSLLLVTRKLPTRSSPHSLAWAVVAVVGLVVLLLVVTLELFPRLGAGEKVIDGARPAFTEQRVQGSRAGIAMVSSIVQLADPLVNEDGGAGAEVLELVSFVSAETGLKPAAVLATLTREFPHTTGLLTALPLEEVSAEIPQLVDFLATTLKMSTDQVMAALQENFPRLTQSIEALPKVTDGWDDVPGTEGLTRFDGSPVRTVPEVRDYFAKDVIPVLERQRSDFTKLADTWPPVDWIPWILTIVAIVVVIYGLLMMFVTGFFREPWPMVRSTLPAGSPNPISQASPPPA